MPYCRYCLSEQPAEKMPSPRTCQKCRDEQFLLGRAKAKTRRKARATRIKNAVEYYFKRSRILHKPFPHDSDKIQVLLRQMLRVNRYKNRLVSVDHIIPVTHPLVCGLTVSWNLQLLLTSENVKKGSYCDLEAEAQYLLQWAKDRGL